MSKIVIVGGGLSGLSAALFLKLKNKAASVTVLEATDRLGGWIKSKQFKDGSVHELGPRTIRMQSPTVNYMLNVIENTDLSDDIISVSKQNEIFNKRYIYTHGQLNLLDFSLLKPAQKPFSESFLLKIVKSGLKKYNHENNFTDLSVDNFVRTRFGDEIADYIINPIIRGIYACDSKDLSTLSTFPTLLEMEKLGPNVVIGSMKHYLKGLFQRNKIQKNPIHNKSLLKFMKESSVLSFHGGLETLIKGLERKLLHMGVDIQMNKPVLKMKQTDSNKLIFNIQNKTIECDGAILAVPSYISASLLDNVLTNNRLNEIHWNTVAVVVLEFKGRLIPNLGFGHLIPSWEIPDTLGVIYDSCILPDNDNRSEMSTRYTVMLGGAWFHPNIEHLNSDELIKKARDALKIQIGVDGELLRSTAVVNHKCIPVYGLNHRNIITTIRKSITDRNLPLQLCGNSFDGVSLSDCVFSGYRAADSLSV